MRRIKISKLNIASISEDGLKKAIENVFDVNDSSQYGFKLKNNSGIVQVGKDYYNVSEKDIFLNDLKKVLNEVMKSEFEKIPSEDFKYYAKVNKLAPINLANTFVDNEVANNESLIKRFGGIVDNTQNVVFVKTKSSENLLGTQELTDEHSDNVKKFRKEYINKDVISVNQLIDETKNEPNDSNKKTLKEKIDSLYDKYANLFMEFSSKLKKETNKYIKEELSEVVRMTKNLVNDLNSWKKEIKRDPNMNFLNKNDSEQVEEQNYDSLSSSLNKILSTNANDEDIKYQKNKLTVGNKTYDVYNESDIYNFLNKKFKKELEDLKKSISDDIGLDLNTEIDDNFKDKEDDFVLNTIENSPKIDFSKLNLSEQEKNDIKNNYGSLGTYYLIEE